MDRRDGLYGRRKGKPLSPRRAALMASLYKALELDLRQPPPDDLHKLFPGAAAVRLEIGFGGGEHLIAEAQHAPDIGFIGVEPFLNGMAKAVAAVDALGLRNLRLHGGDAVPLLDWLPAGALAQVDLLYPDPWPKRRHWKRRIIGAANLDRLARILAPGGLLRFATDVDSYAEWTLLHLTRRTDFVWTAERADDWRQPFSGWTGTRYEDKARAAGRKPIYLAFKRS